MAAPAAGQPQSQPPASGLPQTLLRPSSKGFTAAVAAIAVVVLALAGVAFWRAGAPTVAFPTVAPAVSQQAVPTRAAGTPDRHVVALNPEDFIEPAEGGRLAYSGGDYNQALGLFEDAVAKRPQDAEAWSNLGQVLVRLDRVEQSIERFQRAIELNPDRWAYRFNLARAHGLLGEWDAAVQEYRTAQRLFPDDYATAFNLGLALRKAGDDRGAVDAFKRAIELDPQDPTFHFSLAGTYEKLGQAADAITEYQRTLELAGPAPEVPAIQERISVLKGEPPKGAEPAAVKEPAPVSGSGR